MFELISELVGFVGVFGIVMHVSIFLASELQELLNFCCYLQSEVLVFN